MNARAYVTQAGSPVAIQGAFFKVTGTDDGLGLAGTTPFTPSGQSNTSLSPSGPASTTLTFMPFDTATSATPYDNPLDLSAGIPGVGGGRTWRRACWTTRPRWPADRSISARW